MRKWTHIAASTLILFGALVPAAFAQTAAPQPSLTVDDIIAKHAATKGGLEKWKTIQTQKMTGVATAQGFDLAMTVYGKRPNLSRQELTLEVAGQPPSTIITLFDGTKAWMINPATGSSAPQEAPAPETGTAKVQSDFDGPLLDYKAKGYTVELMPATPVAGKQAHHLKVSRADVPTSHYYLDPDTFVELKITVEGAMASETVLSDYRVIEGVMVPHTIAIMEGGTVQAQLKILKVEFNVPIDDALFRVK